jgi:hypothetical protein
VAHIPASNLPITEFLLISTLTIATSDQGGEPHAAAVYFVADQALNIFFFSDPLSQHAQDVVQRPQAAIVIYPDCQDWQEIRGLQMRGEVRPIDPGVEWESAWLNYINKFPFVSALRELVARNQLYAFSPDWIRLVDNRRGFGFKQEWRRVLPRDDPGGPTWQPIGIDHLATGATRDRA